MKIKVAYGVDTRLWKTNQTQEKPEEQLYVDLLAYICKTFQFTDTKHFRITYKDEDDEMMTIADFQDFQEAFISTKQQNKKSLKLHIVNISQNNPPPQQPQPENNNDNEKKESEPIQTTVDDKDDTNTENKDIPSAEEINAFLSDDYNMDLLSDLFIAVFEALSAAQFEITFIECLQGILLSDDGKYIKLTSNPIWPYFMEELVQKKAPKIEGFVIPMIKMNGGNTEMIKQWIPRMINMMKMHSQNGGFQCWRGRGFRGRGGRGWRRHHHHRHGHHGHHHGHRGGRRGGRRGWRHDHDHHHGMDYNHHGYHHEAWVQAVPQQNQGVNGNNNDEDQIEAEAFEYTEELVAIMNMGFSNMHKIKGLLIEHKGNKEIVVQELVGEKN